MRRVQSPNAVSLTMSLSVSVFEKQWPFVRGLDGSLSDNKMTSSGDGGCRSLLMSLRGGNNNNDNVDIVQGLNTSITPVTVNCNPLVVGFYIQ